MSSIMEQYEQRASGSFATAIDVVHLNRQTMGDRSLEREVLELFRRQARILLFRFENLTNPAERADVAHTLKGSARGVGANRVAFAAEELERAAKARESTGKALAELAEAIAEVTSAIELRFGLDR
ncbi:Hpt domain-containing protein [Hansschlegelia sp.]|uniref:Hpt domain-containing protein n=1 Tax=Hansschlegelia sp. TaxID=2041892 RepID=UPI002CC03852|nr:Hpt domain-containing protein [Hansschlegelia sp.]HVI28966.1 Hpt domain-containing protein [Hansschlegelia sp.]